MLQSWFSLVNASEEGAVSYSISISTQLKKLNGKELLIHLHYYSYNKEKKHSLIQFLLYTILILKILLLG